MATKPPLTLIGENGNAFVILGLAQRAAQKAGWSQDEISKYRDEAMAGDYDHLLQTTMEFFDVH